MTNDNSTSFEPFDIDFRSSGFTVLMAEEDNPTAADDEGGEQPRLVTSHMEVQEVPDLQSDPPQARSDPVEFREFLRGFSSQGAGHEPPVPGPVDDEVEPVILSDQAVVTDTLTPPQDVSPDSDTRHSIPTPKRDLRPRDAAQQGFWGLMTSLCVALGRPQWSPKPGKAEAAQRRMKTKDEAIFKWLQTTTALTIAVGNRKGGGAKTTVASHIATMMALLCPGADVCIIDINPASGTSGSRVDMDERDTVTIRQFLAALPDIKTGNDFGRYVKFNRAGVRAIVADKSFGPDHALSADDMRRIIEGAQRHNQVVILDMGNQIHDDYNLAAIELSDVVVISGSTRMIESLREMRPTMDTWTKHGYDMSQAVLVFNAILPNHDEKALIRLYVNEVDRNDNITATRTHGGPIVTVPWDAVIDSERPANIPALGKDTYEAYQNVVLAIYQSLTNQSQGG